MSVNLRGFRRYGVAIVSVAIATLCSLVLEPVVVRVPSAVFLGAVAVSAWYGGLGPALLAAGLGSLIVDYLFLSPRYSLGLTGPNDLLALVALVAVAVLIAATSGSLHAAHDRAAASETRFRTMFEQSPVSTQILAPDGTSLYANPAWERLWGVSHDQITGYNVLRDPQLVELGIMPYLERGFAGQPTAVPAIDYRPSRTIGGISSVEHRWVSALVYPVRNPAGQIREVVLMHEDITERRQAEQERAELLARERAARDEAEAAVRARDEFLSIASHELRSPITTISAQAQLLLRRLGRGELPDAAGFERGLTHISTQAMKLAELITGLLDVSRLEAGQLVLERRATELAPLLETAVAAAQARTERHQLVLHTTAVPTTPLDPLRIEQVVNNLLDNAIKYSPDGGRIELALGVGSWGVTSTPPAPNPQLPTPVIEISVRDYGLGIPLERRGQIFERFYQAHDDGRRGGVGLGLYISRQIVELHGGQLSAEFPDDGGSRFVVRLPIEPPEA